LIEAFKDVFYNSDYQKQFKCLYCGERITENEAIEKLLSDILYGSNSTCKRCGKDFAPIPYYSNKEVEKIFEDIEEREGGAVIVAFEKCNDKVLGFSAGYLISYEELCSRMERRPGNISIGERLFYLAELGVVPECRGMGIGTALLNEMVEYAEKLGAETVVLRTLNESLSRNMQFYKKRGFEYVRDEDGNPVRDREFKERVYLLRRL
jgi:ribosomal protein S18 acetylase RimI-like enzyme